MHHFSWIPIESTDKYELSRKCCVGHTFLWNWIIRRGVCIGLKIDHMTMMHKTCPIAFKYTMSIEQMLIIVYFKYTYSFGHVPFMRLMHITTNASTFDAFAPNHVVCFFFALSLSPTLLLVIWFCFACCKFYVQYDTVLCIILMHTKIVHDSCLVCLRCNWPNHIQCARSAHVKLILRMFSLSPFLVSPISCS